MDEDVTFDDGIQHRRVQVRRNHGEFLVSIDGEPHKVQAELISPGQLQITLDNKVYKCVVAREGNCRYVFWNGKVYELTKVDKKSLSVKDLGLSKPNIINQVHENDVVSPMPGRIVKILVNEGEFVKAGQDLLIIEAMKMENRITAPFAGKITQIHFEEGDQVSNGTPLMDLDPVKNKSEPFDD